MNETRSVKMTENQHVQIGRSKFSAHAEPILWPCHIEMLDPNRATQPIRIYSKKFIEPQSS